MKFCFGVIIIFLTFTTDVYSQHKAVKYTPPLNITLALSANFGEIRSTHFHGGVDFKTEGVEGKSVVSVADGYVSRISVSPSGYGNAIYITHPSLGVMTVYGHLDRFTSKVASYIKANQYKNRQFKVDLYPDVAKFPVKQSDIIGYSGNSGSSGGPHLHFEVRSLTSGQMLSPLKTCDFAINDNIPPKIISVQLVEVDRSYGIPIHLPTKKYPVVSGGGGVYRLVGDTITLSRDSYLAIEVTEVKNNSTNIFGVTSMELLRGEEKFWGYDINHLSFSFGRAVNGFVLYPESTKTRNDIIRTYIPPENRLSIYKSKVNEGVIYRRELTAPQKFTLTAEDESNNKSTLTFVIKADTTIVEPLPMPEGELVFADKYYTYKDSVAEFSLSPYALQQSAFMKISSDKDPKFKMSHVVEIPDNEAPFNKAAKLSIKTDEISNVPVQKLLIGYISPSGKLSSAGGKYSGGYVSTTINGGGRYVVVCDTINPRIRPLFSAKNPPKNEVAFKITDDLSGVSTYNGYIDDKWVLFEYDAKSATIKHKFDSSIITKGIKHSCRVELSDANGNKSTYKTSFTW